jgi:hypothetical protein
VEAAEEEADELSLSSPGQASSSLSDEGARVLEMRCAEGHLKASKHIINCLPLTNDI